MRTLALLPSIVLAAFACAPAPPPQPQAQRQQTWEEFIRDHPDTFIETRNQTLAADKHRLEQLGLAEDLAAVRAAVDYHLPPGNYTLRATGASAAILRRQNVDTVAQWLVSVGYRAGDVADPKRAAKLVQIASRVITGGGDQKGDAAWLAPTVVLAELVQVVTEPPRTDGLRFSSIRYRVIEPLKNSPAAGSVIRVPGGPVHYPDGTMSASTGDLEKAQPGRYVLFLSQRRLSADRSQLTSPDLYASIFGPLRERDGSFVPTGESSQPEMTLEELRAVIHAQACAEGHVLVGDRQAAPPAC